MNVWPQWLNVEGLLMLKQVNMDRDHNLSSVPTVLLSSHTLYPGIWHPNLTRFRESCLQACTVGWDASELVLLGFKGGQPPCVLKHPLPHPDNCFPVYNPLPWEHSLLKYQHTPDHLGEKPSSNQKARAWAVGMAALRPYVGLGAVTFHSQSLVLSLRIEV